MKWFLDWDGTIAIKSTLATDASIGYRKNIGQSLPPWPHFTRAYVEDRQTIGEFRKPIKGQNPNLEQYLTWQRDLVTAERASIERIEKAGLFANVTEDDVIATAEKAVADGIVPLRRGLLSLFERLHSRGDSLAVLSVNWSSVFIREVLRSSAQKAHESGFLSSLCIHSNEIDFGTNGKLSRKFPEEDRGIWTAQDKARVMQRELGPKLRQRPSSVYVGDESTDLACLLAADLGICIRDEPLSAEQKALKEALELLGIECSSLTDWEKASGEDGTGKKHLWWIRDFSQILDSPLLTTSGIK